MAIKKLFLAGVLSLAAAQLLQAESIELKSGWNSITASKNAAAAGDLNTANVITGDVERIIRGLKSYNQTGGGDLTVIETNKGYFVYAAQDTTLDYSDAGTVANNVTPAEGWQSIGYNQAEHINRFEKEFLYPAGLKLDNAIYGAFDYNSTQLISKLRKTELDKGYWIKTVPASDTEIVANSKNYLSFESFKGANVSPNAITGDLSLPASLYGATISWSSDTPAVIANDGTYTAPADDTSVVLTATITKNATNDTKTFSLTALNGVSAGAGVPAGAVEVQNYNIEASGASAFNEGVLIDTDPSGDNLKIYVDSSTVDVPGPNPTDKVIHLDVDGDGAEDYAIAYSASYAKLYIESVNGVKAVAGSAIESDTGALEDLTAATSTADETAVATAAANLTEAVIKGANSDLYNVTTNLNLVNTQDGVSVAWTISPSEEFLASDGMVTTPTNDAIKHTLTAYITSGAASDTKTFEVWVKDPTVTVFSDNVAVYASPGLGVLALSDDIVYQDTDLKIKRVDDDAEVKTAGLATGESPYVGHVETWETSISNVLDTTIKNDKVVVVSRAGSGEFQFTFIDMGGDMSSFTKMEDSFNPAIDNVYDAFLMGDYFIGRDGGRDSVYGFDEEGMFTQTAYMGDSIILISGKNSGDGIDYALLERYSGSYLKKFVNGVIDGSSQLGYDISSVNEHKGNIVVDGDSLYLAFHDGSMGTRTLVVFDTGTLAETNAVVLSDYLSYIYDVGFDDDYLYVTGSTDADDLSVLKLNKSDLSVVSQQDFSFTGDSYGRYAKVTEDGVYVAGSHDSSTKTALLLLDKDLNEIWRKEFSGEVKGLEVLDDSMILSTSEGIKRLDLNGNL